jgi:hypothetical protein
MRRTTRGVALILVLSVVSIVSIVMLSISIGAKTRIQQARNLLDKTELELRVHSHQSALLFSLLTEPWVSSEVDDLTRSSGPYGSHWNFRGRVFSVDVAKLKIQDESGLFSIPPVSPPIDEFKRLLQLTGFSQSEQRKIADTLVKQGPVQHLSDLLSANYLTDDRVVRLHSLISVSPTPSFNPSTSPEDVLRAKFGDEMGSRLARVADGNALNPVTFFRLTGSSPGEDLVFFPGPALRVSIAVEGKIGVAARESVWLLRPYQLDPVSLYFNRRLEAFSSSDEFLGR